MDPSGVVCAECRVGNRSTAHFCTSCGAPLWRICRTCDERIEPTARFCGACGSPAAGTEASTGTGTSPPEERREVSILFADFVDFTQVTQDVDPEIVKNAVVAGLRRLAEEITAHGGHVDKFVGDNVMGVFGAPRAHEDDPVRAVLAGLAMQRAMAEVNAGLPAPMGELKLRVGINSGEVLAGQVGNSYTVIGSAVNVASRLETACRVGQVLVGESTWSRTRRQIEYRHLEPFELPGLEGPTIAYEAIEYSERPRATMQPRSRFFGRTAELDLLRGAATAIKTNQRPHLVTLRGEAGIGKTRLFEELVSSLEHEYEYLHVRRGHCPGYAAGSPLWPFREILAPELDIQAAGDVSSDRRSLEQLQALLAVAAPEEADLIAGHAGGAFGTGGSERSEDSDPEEARRRLFISIQTVIEAIAADGLLLIGIDDLQWADETTLDLVDYLSRSARGAMLIVCMAREELLDRRPRWGSGRRPATTIRLDELDRATTIDLVAHLHGDAAVGDPRRVERLARRSEGNPLFAEEMTRQLRGEDVEDLDLPRTVQAVLAAQLDELGRDERRLLQHAAVIGERFWEGALQPLAEQAGIDTQRVLARLRELDLITAKIQRGPTGEGEYSFRHALIQEVAYARLPKAVRAHQHARVGAYLEERAGEEMVAVAAHHFERARRFGLESQQDAEFLATTAAAALRTLEAAGDSAASVHSASVALERYETALRIGDPDPSTRVRILEKVGDAALLLARTDRAVEAWSACVSQLEPDLTATAARLHRKLGTALWRRGERSASMEQLRRGIELFADRGPSLELAQLYADAATLYVQTGENMLAMYAAERSLELAEQLEAPSAAARAHGTFGRVFGRLGDYSRARENLEAGLGRAREAGDGETISALLLLGSNLEAAETCLDRAAEAYEEALDVARRVGDVPAQIELHGGIARLAMRACDHDQVERATAAGSKLASREGLRDLSCFSDLSRAWLLWCAADPRAPTMVDRAIAGGRRLERIDVVFSALMVKGWSLSLANEEVEADRVFDDALDVSTRVGLPSQMLEARSARAINLARGGTEPAAARRMAHEAMTAIDRFGIDLNAAAQEASGAAAADPREGARLLSESAKDWRKRSRPLDAARAELLAAWRLRQAAPGAAADALAVAAQRAEVLGVRPLAAEAKRLIGSAEKSGAPASK